MCILYYFKLEQIGFASSSIMQVQNPHSIKYSGTIQGLKYIWRTEGLRGLFKGNGTNCARIVPNSAVKFFSYEEASKYASPVPASSLFSPTFFNMITDLYRQLSSVDSLSSPHFLISSVVFVCSYIHSLVHV